MGEVRSTADYILQAKHCALVSLGHVMVAQRHLWLTLVSKRDRNAFFSAPTSPSGLFGEGLDTFQARFENSKKQVESLRGSMPRKFSRPAQSAAQPGFRSSAKRPAAATALRPSAWEAGREQTQPKQQAGSGKKGSPPVKGRYFSPGKKGRSDP